MIKSLLVSLLFLPQIPFPGPGRASTASGGTVSIVSNSVGAACSDSSTSCAYTSISMTTGNTYVVYVAYCTDASCSSSGSDFTTISVSDGTNTYTEVTAASVIPSGVKYFIKPFVAKAVTGGTYTITISQTGTTQRFYYVGTGLYELSGANASNPIDANISAYSDGSSASPSLTSPGNVSSSGEVMLANIGTQPGFAFTGAFSLLNTLSSTALTASLVHPSAGSPVTLSGTQSSGGYWFSMIGIKP